MTMVAMLSLMSLLVLTGVAALSVTLNSIGQARRDETRQVVFNLSEAGMYHLRLNLYEPFRLNQNFNDVDSYFAASATNPQAIVSKNLNSPARYRYSAAVIGYTATDGYTRDLTLRSVGWIDLDNSGGTAPDPGEPRDTQEARIRMTLKQARVFDYTYFVNNYGWMTGFNSNTLHVNGDMRANGDMNITGGTINGQVIAATNAKLKNDAGTWGAPGIASVTSTVNQTNATYSGAVSSRARQSYNAAQHGAKTSPGFGKWKEVLYDQTPDPSVSMASGILYGSVIADANGTRSLANQATRLSSTPTQLLEMPDLSDTAYYAERSAEYADTKATYADGSANPDFGQAAYIEVWDTTLGSYRRVTGNLADPPGVISGSIGLIGDAAHPIKIHGPVTVLGDVAIKGVIQGQGTLYTGRNVHVIGNIQYADPPSFAGSDPTAIDLANEKKDVLGLCARGSVIMGNTTTFGGNPLNYMKPPFTKDRIDDQTGSIISAFNADTLDTGYTMNGGGTPKKYQSLLGNSWINANSSPIGQVDAVIYTNNVCGGLVGDPSQGGLTINGTIISKDEAMVTNLGSGGRLTFNYDSRIKERSAQQKPLVDIRLPRIPQSSRLTWKEIFP